MGAPEIAGIAAGGAAVLGTLLGVIWSQAVMWLRVQQLWASAERYPLAVLAEKVDTLWEYTVLGALERSRLLEGRSRYRLRQETLPLVTEELKGAVREVKEEAVGENASIGELAFRVQRKVGLAHLVKVAAEAQVGVEEVLALVAALVGEE